MRILFVASECFPLIKTGGLADVVGALPLALAQQGHEVDVLLPGFPKVIESLKKPRTVSAQAKVLGKPAKLIGGTTENGLSILALAAEIFDIDGNPYQLPGGDDRPDNGQRYGAFCRAAADLAMGRMRKKPYDVVHVHDWQAGLIPAYLDMEKTLRPASVLTIHNLAFQGIFEKDLLPSLGFPESYFSSEGFEYWDKVSFLKAAMVYSDHITTVSPTYALEIQSDDGGMGFGGLLRARGGDLSGILNGIDLEVWNPATDPAIAAHFSSDKPAGKAKCKAALQKEMGLKADKHAPLFAVISRLTTQKGLDLLARATDQIKWLGGQLVVLGSGDSAIEDAFKTAAENAPDQIACTIGYDEPLAHRIQAGADAILIPSRFEPCGLTQLCAMRYGTVPVVGRVGGLADTVIDANEAAQAKSYATGVQFHPINDHMLAAAINRTFEFYKDKKGWGKMVSNALTQPVGWEDSAAKYAALYASLVN